MSYLDTLKGEDIPPKKPKKQRAPTAYDRFMDRKKKLLTEEKPQQVSAIKPANFDEIRGLLDRLRLGEGLVIDLSGVSGEVAQRMLDFLSGAVYALNGSVKRIHQATFLFTPKNISISSL